MWNNSFGKLHYSGSFLRELSSKAQLRNLCNGSARLFGYIDSVCIFSHEEESWEEREITLSLSHELITNCNWRCNVRFVSRATNLLVSLFRVCVCVCVIVLLRLCLWICVSLNLRQKCCKNVITKQIFMKFFNFNES